MSGISSEAGGVQYPLIGYATEVGWSWVPREHAVSLRRGETGIVFHEVLVDQLQLLNPGVVDLHRAEDIVKTLTRVRPTIEGNEDAWEYLRGLKTVFVPDEDRERNVRLVDLEHPERNVFQVTDEFQFTNGTKTIRPDVVFLINGVPVIVEEDKAATKKGGIADAFDQVRRYHREAPELMVIPQLYSLNQLVHFYYGATWSLTRKFVFNWRDEAAGDSYEQLVKSFVHPQRILRVLTDFILFTRMDDELVKVVLRPHQMRAVDRVTQRAWDEDSRRGLIWHTQGSGKTFTMIVAAKQIIENPVFENPTVLMLVDRNELETQLFGNLEAIEFGHVELADSKRDLQDMLAADQRGLIVSTIHKFDKMPADINTRRNVIVLIDEAHRTTGGDLGNYLMGALPNATYIGFTGTPIDRTAHGKGTFKVFAGGDEKGYLDKYSIRESIDDGTTVPLHYSLAPNDLRVDRDVLEEEFLSLADAEGISDVEELDRVLQRAVTLKNMLKNPERIDRVAKYVAEHYTATVEPMGYKAFLVGVDREACALLKTALDQYLPPDYSKVVYSSGHNDPEHLASYHLSEDDEKAIRKAFRKPDQLPKILIVTEKLLTGFDAPILYAMYLDKPMRDHVLLQAIARVNRPFEDDEQRRKPAGFVLDFVGIFENLEKALAFDSADVTGVIEDLDILRRDFVRRIAEGRQRYLPIGANLTGDKKIEAVLNYFREHDPDEYYQWFRELEELYEILSPDEFLRPYVTDFGRFAEIYRLLKASFDRVELDRSFLRKTAELVQQQTHSGEIHDPDDVYVLSDDVLDVLAASDKPDTVKVFNLLKVIEQDVRERGPQAPYLLGIGERAQQVAQQFHDRQITTQEALEQLTFLFEERQDADTARADTDMSIDAFSVYWLLQGLNVEDPEPIARAAEDVFTAYPHWRSSQAQEMEVRRGLYKTLIDAKVSNVSDVATFIIEKLKTR